MSPIPRSPISLSLQLWSLRQETTADAEGTLRKVPSLGFDAIELAGTYDWPLEKWQQLLAETGLKVSSAHIGWDVFAKDLSRVIAFQKGIGNSRYIVPSLPPALQTVAGYREVARVLNQTAQALKAEGGRVYYHNHDFEFKDLGGTHGYQILLDETDPDAVSFEVDTFWVERTGRDAYQFVVDHASRIGLLHAKDLRRSDQAEVPVGAGDIAFPSLLSLAKANAWPVVLEYEQGNALQAVAQGATHLRQIFGKMR